MKKLNRKGFTLIELLAIIVILAIIMVVTIPTLLDVMDDSTAKQFKNSANAIEKWVSEQYALAAVGSGTSAFTAVCGNTGKACMYTNCAAAAASPYAVTCTGTSNSAGAKSVVLTADSGKAFLDAAGQDAADYSSLTVQVKENGRVCVKVKPNSTAGNFSGVDASKDTESNGC